MKILAATTILVCLSTSGFAQSANQSVSSDVPDIVRSINVTQSRHYFIEPSFENCTEAGVNSAAVTGAQGSDCGLAQRFWGKSKQTLSKTLQKFTPQQPKVRKNLLSKLGKVEFNF